MQLRSILETVIYCDSGEREAVERFYGGTLSLREVARWEDGTAFRIGPGVLLLFDRELLGGRASPMSAHGTSGPGHVCLLADAGEYERWAGALRDAGIEITHEQEWREGRRSFYFQDPAGNLLEIASGDIWPPDH